jgi:hypothetical protein
VGKPLGTRKAKGRNVSLPRLLGLLRLCVQRTEVAIAQMRFDASVPTDRDLIALLLGIADYSRGVIAAGNARTFAVITGATRSALDAYVDIANLCDDPGYWKHLDAADSGSWTPVLQAASRGGNPFLKGIAESEFLIPGRSLFAKRRKALESAGIKKLEIKERFQRAGLTNEHEAAYGFMSAEAHNNVSFLVSRYFELSEDTITLRRPDRENLKSAHYELPCTLLMSEILLRSTEKVLRHFGHGVAVLSKAAEKFAPIAAAISGTADTNSRSKEDSLSASAIKPKRLPRPR